MKKNLFILAIVFTLFSCQQSNESLIKKEFKNYVKNNFDNPKSLKEIVSIEASDTVSVENFKMLLKETLTNYDRVDSLWKNDEYKNNINKNILKKEYNFSYSDILIIRSYYGQLANITQNRLSVILKDYNILENAKNLLDSIKYDPPKYGYNIKFRQTKNGELQLFTYKGYIDSLTKKIHISPQGFELDDKYVSGQMKELSNMILECTIIVKRYLEQYKDETEIYDKLNNMAY